MKEVSIELLTNKVKTYTMPESQVKMVYFSFGYLKSLLKKQPDAVVPLADIVALFEAMTD